MDTRPSFPRLELEGHPDQPEWLSHVNASVLKIELAMAIIGISSIHLLRTFIEAGGLGSGRTNFTETGIMWQTIIHCVFGAICAWDRRRGADRLPRRNQETLTAFDPWHAVVAPGHANRRLDAAWLCYSFLSERQRRGVGLSRYRRKRP